MYPVSDAFAAAIAGDHVWTTRVRVLLAADEDPVDISQYFEGGSLRVGRNEIRRSGTLTFVDSDGTMVPLSAGAPLAPFGQELLIDCGIVYPDGTEELIPQGVFRITKVTTRYPIVTCTVSDRMWIVKRALLETPLTIAAGTMYTTAIRQLITTAYPRVEFVAQDVALVTPTLTLDAFADPAAEAHKMATVIGHELYFDRAGTCYLVPEADHAGDDPVLTYSDSSDQFIPRADEDWRNLATFDQELEWDTEDVVNRIVATGENSDNSAQFRGVATDTDPTSPTRYDGPFGRSPMEWRSPLITSNEQATVAAATQLQKMAGISEGLRIPAIPHPALDLGDPIRVVRRDLGLDQIHVVDGFNVPLRATGDQVIETRRRRVVSISA